MASFTQLDIINKSFLETRGHRGAKDERSRGASRTNVESHNEYKMEEGVLICIDDKIEPIHSPSIPTNHQSPSLKPRRPATADELEFGIKNEFASFGRLGSDLQTPWLCRKDPPKEIPPRDSDNFEVALNALMDTEAKVETEKKFHSISSQ